MSGPYFSRLTLLQLAVMVSLCALLLAQLLLPAPAYDGPADNAAPNPAGQTTLPQPRMMLSETHQLDDFNAISERPLFHSTRAPEEVVDAQTAAQTPERSPQQDWILTGTIINGDERIALFSKIGKRQTSSLRSGMQLGEWRLEAVNAEGVIFSKNGQQIEMPLIKESTPQRRTRSTSSSLFKNQSQYNQVVRPME